MILQDKIIAVTGGTGLLGVHLVAELLGRGCRVRLLVRDMSRAETLRLGLARLGVEDLFERVECVETALNDPHTLKTALGDADVVFHCAAEVSFESGREQEVIEANTEMTSHVADCCLACGVERMIHVSSIAALGEPARGESFITEESTLTSLKGRSAYSVSKFYAENAVRRAMTQGLNAVIVNPAIILGEGDWTRGSSRLIAVAAQGNGVASDGVKGYVDVRDAARAMVLLAGCDAALGQRFILSGGNLSFRELFAMSARAAGRRAPVMSAGRPLLNLAVRAERLWSRWQKRSPVLSEAFVDNAVERSYYSGEKVKRVIEFEYTPLAETVRRVTLQYLKDRKS